MNAQELRIGNLIKLTDTGEIMTVTGIVQDSHGVKVYGIAHDKTYCNPWIDHCEPISITEDWLIRAGFVKVGDTLYRTVTKSLDYQFFISKTCNGYNTTDATLIKSLQYVHQLQNLYFALTGSELEINY